MSNSMNSDPSKPVSFWFSNQRARLYAVAVGHGRPVVFLHGGLADHRSTLFRAGMLASSYRLIAPDVRGSGRSLHAGPLSWEVLADDVAALLDHLGAERAVIGGASMGSGIALRFALDYPRRTAGLLLVSPLYPGQNRGLTAAQAAAMRIMNEAGQEALERGIEALLPLYERLPAPMRERAVEMARGFDPSSVAATTGFLASGAQPFGDVVELAAIEVPVLIVPGADPEHPAEVTELHVRHLRAATIVEKVEPELLALAEVRW
jgi:3-oxoadipate enol-lactonase